MSGVGLIGTVIVLAIVLWLAVQNWKAATPALMGTDRDAEVGIDSRTLPGLDHLEQQTGEHADRLEEALKEIE